MSGIRPLEPADVPAAAALFERMQRTGSSAAGLEAWFRSILFEDPWHDPELPSLVLEDEDGAVAGFYSRATRRFRFDGEPLRASITLHFFVAPEQRGRASGALLGARLLGGRQDFTHTDGPTEATLRMWTALRGTVLATESLEWTRILRPVAYWNERLARHRAPRLASAARRLAPPLDAGLTRAGAAAVPKARELRTTDEPLTPALMAEHLEALTSWARLRPDYDEPYLRWLFEQLGGRRTSYGDLSARLVRRDGEPIGWHVALIPHGGTAETLQLVARPEDMSDVFDAYLAHAAQAGAVAARGRLDPAVSAAVTRERSILRRGNAVLLRARDPQLTLAALRGETLLSRLDANMWMDSHGR